jgi:hypothetical protein
VRVAAKAYIVSTMLLSTVAWEVARWENFEIVRSIDGDQLRRVEFSIRFAIALGVVRRRFFRGKPARAPGRAIAPVMVSTTTTLADR